MSTIASCIGLESIGKPSMAGSNLIFEDLNIGDPLGPVQLFVSKDQTRRYARVCGFYVPRFTDDEGARKEGLPGMERVSRPSRIGGVPKPWSSSTAKIERVGAVSNQG